MLSWPQSVGLRLTDAILGLKVGSLQCLAGLKGLGWGKLMLSWRCWLGQTDAILEVWVGSLQCLVGLRGLGWVKLMLSWRCRLVAYGSNWPQRVGLGPPGCSLPNRLFFLFRQVPDMAAKIPRLRAVSVALCGRIHFGHDIPTIGSTRIYRTGAVLCSATLWFPVDVIVNQFCYILDTNKLDKWVGSRITWQYQAEQWEVHCF